MLRSSSTLPFSLILLSLSLVLQWQILPGVYAQASQAPPTTFGTATGSASASRSSSGSLTGSAVSGSATASNSSSASASATNTADLPGLSGYSPCVVNCFQMAIGQAGCNSVVPAECYCNKANYTSFLLSCMQSDCPSELSTVESLTNQFCAIASPSTSISFPITAFPSSAGAGSTSGSGNGSSSVSATGPSSSSPSVSDAGTSNAAMGRGVGTMMNVAGGQLVGVALTLVGVLMGALVVL